jgi:hypothetical protein
MRKPLLLIAATLILAFFIFSLFKWIEQGHTFKDVWWSMTNDWFVAATFFDALVFMSICTVWLVSDMKKRGWTVLQMILVIIALILTGSATFLTYLAFRKPVLREQQPI